MLADVEFREVVRAGVRLRVAVKGSGPLVVLVHGFPESWISWRHQIPAIANDSYTVVAMETRGYGQSSKPDAIEAYTIREMADDIAAVIDAFDRGGAVIIGHDWGAAQVYGAALLHPEKIRALVGLAFTAGPFVDRKVSEMWDEFYPNGGFYQNYFKIPGEIETELEADIGGFLRKFLYALAGDRPEGVNGLVRPAGTPHLLDGLPDPDPLPAWLTREALDYYVGSFRQGGLLGPINRYRAQDLDVEQMRPYAARRITQPALWIGGERDPARFLVPGVDRYLDPIPRCADPRGAVVLPGVGHWIQQEAPDKVNELILKFLREIR
jgi:pimeloyl-ACP methyl ester carboxylesterase